MYYYSIECVNANCISMDMSYHFYRKQQEKELGLNSDDDSEPEESSRSSNKPFPRRSLAIQSGHKVSI